MNMRKTVKKSDVVFIVFLAAILCLVIFLFLTCIPLKVSVSKERAALLVGKCNQNTII